MGSVYKEISRLETAKQDIETAIEYCGVNVPDSELIDTYANYIRQIPSAVFSQLNADLVGGTDMFISSIKQTNGIIEATAGGLVSASYSGLVPKIGTTAADTIKTPGDEWVLTSTKGAQPTWRKLPANAFKNDDNNTTYTFTSGNGGFTVTPSGGTAQTVSIGKPATAGTADKLATVSKTAWGQTYWTSDGVPTSISGDMTGVGIINGILNLKTQAGNASLYLETASNNTDYAHLFVSTKNDKTHTTRPLVLQLGYGNVGIGVAQPTQKLDVDGNVKAISFIGNLDGTYVNKLTGYTKATSAAALAATDTLNAALGKLEYTSRYAYDWVISVTATDTDEYINKWTEIVEFLDSVKEGTDILDEFVTRKTEQTITAAKTFDSHINIRNLFTDGNYYGVRFLGHQKIGYLQLGQHTGSTKVHDGAITGINGVDLNTLAIKSGVTTFSGSITASKFIKSGGTSAQFLKADGSVDSNTYATTTSLGSYLPLAGGMMTGNITFDTNRMIMWHQSESYSISCPTGSDGAYLLLKAHNGITIKKRLSIYTTAESLPNTNYNLYTDGSLYAASATFGATTITGGADLTLQAGSKAQGDAGDIVFKDYSGAELGRIWLDSTASQALSLRYGANDAVKRILHSGNAYISNGTITINGASITPLTSHQSLANYVTLNTAQTISGVKTFSSQQKFTVAQGTSPFTVTSTTQVDNLNAQYVNGYNETSFFRSLRGDVDTSYIDLTTATNGQAAYKNYNSGTYTVPRTGHSDTYVCFRSSGSASAIELLCSYGDTSRLKLRKTVDSSRISGGWRDLAFLSDVPTKLSQLTNDSGYMLKSEALTLNLVTITKAIKLTKDWQDTGIVINETNFPGGAGTYAVQVFVNAGNEEGFWHSIFSGVASFQTMYTNGNDPDDEILLHHSSHGCSRQIYLKTKPTLGGSGYNNKLYIACNTNCSSAISIVFKFKKLI